MRFYIRLLALLLLSHLVLMSAQAKLYRWVDDSGNVHYSDKLPPDAAGKAHQQLSKEGDRVKKNVERAKTAAEIAIEKKVAQAQQRIEAERKKREQARKLQDKVLMDTFSDEKDIELMRDNHLAAIDANIKLTKRYNVQIQEQIAQVDKRANFHVERKREVPENISQQRTSLEQQLKSNMEYMFRMEREKQEINAKFIKDLARFRELKLSDKVAEKDSFEGIDLAKIRGMKNIPNPSGDFYGYPLFPGKRAAKSKIMQHERFKDKQDIALVGTDAKLDTIEEFFIYSTVMLNCMKRQNVYTCPTKKGAGKVSIEYSTTVDNVSNTILYVLH